MWDPAKPIAAVARTRNSVTVKSSGSDFCGSNDLGLTAQRICRHQHGVLSRQQLLAAGFARTTIDRRLRTLLFPLFPGVYAVGRPQIGQEGLWIAGVLAAGTGGVLAGRSAGAAWGFMKIRPGVDVIRQGAGWSVRRPIDLEGKVRSIPLSIRRTRSLPDRDVRLLRGIPMVSPARCLLDLAASLTPTAFRHAYLEADRLRFLEEEDLADCVARGRGRPGAAAYRAMYIDRVPDIQRAKSLLEGLILDVCRRDGVEAPEVNVVIEGYEVDCVWRGRRVAIELDGYRFHRGLEKFEADLARNNRFGALGWKLLRFTWRRVTREPDQVLEELRKALGTD